jgi:hypothetical protein
MASFTENASKFNRALANHDHAGITAHLADDATMHQGDAISSYLSLRAVMKVYCDPGGDFMHRSCTAGTRASHSKGLRRATALNWGCLIEICFNHILLDWCT